VELLVVMGIIVVLLTMLLVALGRIYRAVMDLGGQ
jgi:hypothetical protein